ncbi:hypothetical protein HX109_02020 [Galbibacter sp. BG1]|uniref:hypothetical protein n=1 Tax=Galbibacter sp. BG1 TaxID=1170699 RepID=UPI0015BD2317|nr:hypothetical protein [Galbibacter sp. BG1]QLE00392.1 hypothetical protein HX109_02020 [Galbibacter sp. BG1]
MKQKEKDNIEVYSFIGVVAFIVFLGYDGFFHEEINPTESGGSWKSKMGGLLRWFIWKIGEDHFWLYLVIRGMFLVITLWMCFKIYKKRYQKK